jgi:hypothetical protein
MQGWIRRVLGVKPVLRDDFMQSEIRNQEKERKERKKERKIAIKDQAQTNDELLMAFSKKI